MNILSFTNVPLLANPHPHFDEKGNHLDSIAVILDKEKELDYIKAGFNVRHERLWGPYIVMYCVSERLKEKNNYPDGIITEFPKNLDIPKDRVFVGSVKFLVMTYSIKGKNEQFRRCCLSGITI